MGPVVTTSINRAVRDGFETINPENWEITQGDGDLIELGGNTAGSGYLKISKSTDRENTETVLLSKFIVDAPFRMGFGMSLSQRLYHQRFSLEFVGVDGNGNVVSAVPQPLPVGVASLTQTTTTLTVTTQTPHGFVPGDRINIYGVSDSRFNYGEVYVATVTSITVFTVTANHSAGIPSLTTAGPANSGYVVKMDPVNYADNALGVFWEGTSASNAKMISRTARGPILNSADTSFGTNHTNATIPNTAAYADSFNAAYTYDIRYRSDGVLLRTLPMDSLGGAPATIKRTQVIPEINNGYRVRIRARNNLGATRVVAKIASAVKSASAVATITTQAPHGLAVGDYVQIYGIRDQANFANATVATAVASVVDATNFTITIGASATATSYGGVVIRVNGTFTVSPTAQVIQSIARQDNFLTVTGNANWTGLSIGETVDLNGIYDITGVPMPELEGAFKIASISTTTLTLYSVGDNFAAFNVGGAVLKRTDFRLHLFRMLDYARTVVDIDAGNGNTSDASETIPVSLINSVSISTLTNGQTAHDGAITGNPVRIGARALTANYATVATGDAADLVATTVGALITKPYTVPELDWQVALTAITGVTDNVLKTVGPAGIRNYCTAIQMKNVSATATEVVIKDGTTPIWRGYLPANMSVADAIVFPTPLRGSTVTSMYFTAITTGANIYVSAQGYQAP